MEIVMFFDETMERPLGRLCTYCVDPDLLQGCNMMSQAVDLAAFRHQSNLFSRCIRNTRRDAFTSISLLFHFIC